MSELLCPKCQAALKSVERNGVTLDRCVECGGIFLDRGELERLMAAERSYLNHDEVRHPDRSPEVHNYEYEDDDRGGPKKRRRKSFLEDIFDFG